MGSNGISRDWSVGLQVLIVDHDTTSSKKLETSLKNLKHKVCKCSSIEEAHTKLKGETGKGNFDIVMINANMEGNNGFKLIEHVASLLDLPVLMMTSNGNEKSVKKGIRRGACGILLKPITFKDVEYIWQHVYRKKNPQIVGEEEEEEDSPPSSPVEGKIKRELSHCFENGSPKKKCRAVWTEELNSRFEKAVVELERTLGRCGPKRILEKMNEIKECNLTREQVASHLQKYRGKKQAETCDANINPPLHQNQMIDEEGRPLTREQLDIHNEFTRPQVYNTNTNTYQKQQQQPTRYIAQNMQQQGTGMGMDGYSTMLMQQQQGLGGCPPMFMPQNINPIQQRISQNDQSFSHPYSRGFNTPPQLQPHPIGNMSSKNEQSNAHVFIPQNPIFNAPPQQNQNQNQNHMFNPPNLASTPHNFS